MKALWILFPCSPLDGLRKVDEDFQKEYEAAVKAGIKTFFFDHDKLVKRGEVEFNEYPKGAIVLLRGWMLTLEQYTELHATFCTDDVRMFTSPDEYEHKHYWPKAYERFPILRSLSPRCFWTTGPAFSVKHIKQFFGGGPIVVKDHVKSAKGAKDAMFIEDSSDKYEVWKVIENMIRERGSLFQRGIVFKEKVEIFRDGDKIEFRAFFCNGRTLSVEPNGCKWSYLRAQMASTDKSITTVLEQVGLDLGKGFYTVDLALVRDKSGSKWVVMECGDGQVSGLTPNADPMFFYERLRYSIMGERLREEVLNDDHPVHWDYLYVIDGKVTRCDVKSTVGMWKHYLRKDGIPALEITSCDIYGRMRQQDQEQGNYRQHNLHGSE